MNISEITNILKAPIDLSKFLNKEIEIPYLTEPIDSLIEQGKNFCTHLIAKPEKKSALSSQKNFILEGTLCRGYNTKYSIGGKDIVLTSSTWTFGNIRIGCHVKAKGFLVSGTERVCTSLIGSNTN